ncbi:MAG: siphovirus ReqiPepy6 Gp37-like family protein [Oscillospiraceae bacterium]
MVLELYENYTAGVFAPVDDIGAFSSLRWRRKYFEAGEVEVHLLPTARNVADMQAGRILLRQDAIEGCIIHDVSLTEVELAIEGRMLSHILKDRVIYPTFSFSGKAEVAMRKLVEAYAITNNPIPMLRLGQLNGFAETVEQLQVTGKDLLTTLTAIAKASLIGFRIRPDVENNALWFEAYKGTDRTDPETVEQPVEFSPENKNMENASIEEHDGDYYNFAYVAGEGEGEARTIVPVDQTGGEYRREMWVDARDLQKGGLTAAQYSAILKQRGAEKLAVCKMLRSFSADAIDRAGSAYKKDWDLGDTVAASREDWGAYRTDMVTEAEEVFEGVAEAPTVTPTLGSGLPETIDLES